MVIMKRAAKELDINRRHSGALSGNDRSRKKLLMRIFNLLMIQHGELVQIGNLATARRIWRMIRICLRNLLHCVSIPMYDVIAYNGERVRIDSESIQDAMIAVTYRFKSRQQLRELYIHLQIPEWIILPAGGHRIHGEEVLLMSLERCALGTRLVDMQLKYHIYHSVIGKALHFFAEWMQNNWGYLIHDNNEFWIPYLAASCEAIRQKLSDQYDVEVDEIGENEDGFRIAQFIDCMIIPSSRTGGGPMTPGRFAERFPLLVQESFYSGWARVHGIKKQGMGMANGMAFNVSKGYSARRHDMHLPADTDMNGKLEVATNFMCFGDSAYPHMSRITSRNNVDEFVEINKGLNGCRISIEWMFRDIATYWKLVAKSDILKLLGGFVRCDNLIDLCFIYSNAHNCMNGNEISQWFELSPPTFQVYTSQGRQQCNNQIFLHANVLILTVRRSAIRKKMSKMYGKDDM